MMRRTIQGPTLFLTYRLRRAPSLSRFLGGLSLFPILGFFLWLPSSLSGLHLPLVVTLSPFPFLYFLSSLSLTFLCPLANVGCKI